ncbi:hypothetical protein AX17_000770 [Amanita inopinata Kibby_2008]|nr:hypothetical protein AX17_000770 [Amanita inopinata Kibby_2008]
MAASGYYGEHHFGDSANTFPAPHQPQPTAFDDVDHNLMHMKGPEDHFSQPERNGYSQNSSQTQLFKDSRDASLVQNAADVGRQNKYQDLEYADPYDVDHSQPKSQESPTAFSKFFASGKYPLEQRIEAKKRGIGRQKHPFVVYFLTAVMISVFIYELVLNAREQGSPFSFKPVVNPMLGPSSSALIYVGARYPACMKLVQAIPPSTNFGCLNNTANPPNSLCTLEQLCSFGGFHGKAPSQWFRFITPIFLHAGIIHLLLNMFAQYLLSGQIEREMGSGGFLLAFMTIELLIGIAIGYIPYVDNFAHIGGFTMGLLIGTIFYPVISATKRHRLVIWAFRVAAIPLAIILFVVLIRNFYTSDPYAGMDYIFCHFARLPKLFD